MPLPAALQAKLKKRGIVVEEEKKEEIIVVEKPKKPVYKSQPLPPGWFCVPDPSTGHEYYWNVHTNQVAWRHPNDPKADITYPAAWQQPVVKPPLTSAKDAITAAQEAKDNPENEEILHKAKQKIKTGKHPSLMKAQKAKDRMKKSREKDDPLDPMDPASYSDIGRGTWSSGLKEDSDVKTGVDTTANGPLFQQRPYPSPGDILRRNRAKKEA